MSDNCRSITALFKIPEVCELLRPLAHIHLGLTTRVLAGRVGLEQTVAKKYLHLLQEMGFLRFSARSKRWSIVSSKDIEAQIHKELFKYEVSLLRKKKDYYCAREKILFIDELAKSIFYARKSLH